ncbi:MAG TPA: hypothetical protein PKA64_03725 [Myxococcota bacterium]|nr:hypothetical protein [Myxococcota bacterium]
MTQPPPLVERLRALGLFDLQPQLAGLLREVAEFLQRHQIQHPLRFEHRHDPSRGWVADLELSSADFQRVFHDWPMPIKAYHDQEGRLHLEAELRAGRLRCVVPIHEVEARMSPHGVVIPLVPSAPAHAPPGAPRVSFEPRR